VNLENLLIGHVSCANNASGVTVFLFEERSTCGWWLCGSAPATREVSLLNPDALVDRIDALVFTGGSALGLGATNGVMQWLVERGRGYATQHGAIPIVPTASIYDLSENGVVIPTPEDAYQACEVASKNNKLRGRVGAGSGAIVGKWLANAQRMVGGFGYAELTHASGLQVMVCAVVNCVGDVIDAQGRVVAGARDASGQFINFERVIAHNHFGDTEISQQNTTLVAVFTNADLNKMQLTRVAKTASSGMARAIRPVFTCYDGDVVFAASLGSHQADEFMVGMLAAEATRVAILNAVLDGIKIFGDKNA
jgi:L-aminopeptidase/D-esterase-like protein